MKRKTAVLAALVLLLSAAYLIGTGFQENTSAVLADYTVSEDGTEIALQVGVMTSMGYLRGYQDRGGGVKPHYLVFYSTFGGLNSRLGAKGTFTLELSPDDTEIWFNRPGGGYELVLVKNEAAGQWNRP